MDVDTSKHYSEGQPLIEGRGLEEEAQTGVCTLVSPLPADPSLPPIRNMFLLFIIQSEVFLSSLIGQPYHLVYVFIDSVCGLL